MTGQQTAGGKVLWNFMMSRDGFVAGPNHEMDWMTGFTVRPDLIDEYIENTGFEPATSASRTLFQAFLSMVGVWCHWPNLVPDLQ